MGVTATCVWNGEESFATYGTYDPVSGGNRARLAFWDAVRIARRIFPTRDDLSKVRPLGYGKQWSVDLYEYKASTWPANALVPDLFAIKTAKKCSASETNNILDQYDIHRFSREVQILTHVSAKSHPNIVRFVAAAWDDSEASIPVPQLMIEYAPLGSLSHYLKTAPPLDFWQKLQLIADIASALTCLHTAGIIHGDLKLDNVLVFPGGSDAHVVAKLSDFGCAITAADQLNMRKYHGTRSYISPELKHGREESIENLERCEIFVFGLCMWEILQDGRRHWVHPETGGGEDEEMIAASAHFDEYFDEYCKNIHALIKMEQSQVAIAHTATISQALQTTRETVRSCLDPDPHMRPQSRNVLARAQLCLGAARTGSLQSSSTTNKMQPGTMRWNSPCIWRYSSMQDDVPYGLQRKLVSTLENTLSSTSGDDLAHACLILSYAAVHGYGGALDVTKSFDYLRRAVKAGSESASFLVQRLLPAMRQLDDFDSPDPAGLTAEELTSQGLSELLPGVLDLSRSLESLPQDKQFNFWWRELSRFGRMKFCTLDLRLVTHSAIHQLSSPLNPDEILHLIQNCGVDPSDSVIENRSSASVFINMSTLHLITEHGWINVLQSWVDRRGALPMHVPRPSWYTGVMSGNCDLLLTAAMNGQEKMMLYLLNNAVSLSDACSSCGNVYDLHNSTTGLHYLGMFREDIIDEIAVRLVKDGVEPNSCPRHGAFWSSVLLEAFPIPLGGCPPLSTAIWLRSRKAVEVLLSLGANPLLVYGDNGENSDAQDAVERLTPLSLAVSFHQYEIVEVILEHLRIQKPSKTSSAFVSNILRWIAGDAAGGEDLWRRWLMHGSEWQRAVQRTVRLCIDHGANLAGTIAGWNPLPLVCNRHPVLLYVMEALLEAGCDPNRRIDHEQGLLPAHSCIRDWWSDAHAHSVLALLFKHGANLSLGMLNDGRNCVHLAANNDWTECLKFLDQVGVDLHLADSSGNTPLFHALLNKAPNAVRFLLDSGAEVNVFNAKNTTPLNIAIQKQELMCVTLLLQHGADIQKDSASSDLNALEVAAAFGTIQIFDIILAHMLKLGHDPGDSKLVLDTVVRYSRLDMLRYILKTYPSHFSNQLSRINRSDYSLLHSAVYTSQETICQEMVSILCAAGVPTNLRKEQGQDDMARTALALSVEVGNIAVAKTLLDMGASPFCRGPPAARTWTFIHEAIIQARKPEAQKLRDRFGELLEACRPYITRESLLDIRDWNGRTPLHLAICCGRADEVKMLIQEGSSVEDKVVKTLAADFFLDVVGMDSFQLAYEIASYTEGDRYSHLTEHPGVPDIDVWNVIQVLEGIHSPEHQRSLYTHMVWHAKSLWRRRRVIEWWKGAKAFWRQVFVASLRMISIGNWRTVHRIFADDSLLALK